MSTTFKNARQKLSQAELRKIMNEHKGKQKGPVKKIESPLAKYNDLGQLTCILCKSVVRSETVWPVHINSKQHKQNVEQAKKLKQQTNNFTTAVKRPLTPPVEVPQKKLKGILKNAPNRKEEPEEQEDEAMELDNGGLPKDFFDSKKPPTVQNKVENMDVGQTGEAALPEGFFDDPKLDAKARNIEYKDPIEEEWEKFQKEIRMADNVSANIIAEDQEEATNERQIDEIEEQMKNWSRVLTLEKKKTEIIPMTLDKATNNHEEGNESENEDNFDEYLDWRSKKSFKK